MQGGGELPWEVTCRGVVDGIAMVIHMTRREGRRFVEEAAFVQGLRSRGEPLGHSAGLAECRRLLKNRERLPGPGGAREGSLRLSSPQARHHFTRFDQVDQLVRASEATPDTGFMARLMMLCSLPRTNPGTQLQYKRVNGPYTLIMTAVGQTGLPFGNLSAPVAGLGMHRGRADPIPRAVPGALALRVHAPAGHGSNRGWQPGCPNAAAQPDEAALQRAYPAGLRR